MKKINILCLFLLIFLLFNSCSDKVVEPVESDPQFVQIFFKYYHKNELNTFDKTYQKDLIMDGTIKVYFWLTTEEQNEILKKANEINFFSFPDIFPSDPGIIIRPDPGDQILRIKTDNEDHQTQWTISTILIDTNDPQTVKLKELISLIISIIEAKAEYKNLPPSRGGYN